MTVKVGAKAPNFALESDEGNRIGLGDFLFLDNLDACDLFQRGGALGVRLIVAVVILGTHIDEAHGDVLGRHGSEQAEREKC